MISLLKFINNQHNHNKDRKILNRHFPIVSDSN